MATLLYDLSVPTFLQRQAMIGNAETALESFIPDEVNSRAARNLDLQIGPRRLAGCAARKARLRGPTAHSTVPGTWPCRSSTG
jgi:hypothetical protein